MPLFFYFTGAAISVIELTQTSFHQADQVFNLFSIEHDLAIPVHGKGSVRQTGLHACGVIIGRNNLTEHLPVCKSKDSDLLVTQFDGHFVEDVGMLKMDFLGLKTLSIIKDAVANVRESRGIEIEIDNLGRLRNTVR